jgi:hypothetical protein
MLSGAVWICAAGLFFLTGFLAGFRFSWLVFVFALAVQLVIRSLMIKPGSTGTLKNTPEEC